MFISFPSLNNMFKFSECSCSNEWEFGSFFGNTILPHIQSQFIRKMSGVLALLNQLIRRMNHHLLRDTCISLCFLGHFPLIFATEKEVPSTVKSTQSDWNSSIQSSMLQGTWPKSAKCVQIFDDSQAYAIRFINCISLHSSSLWNPRNSL